MARMEHYKGFSIYFPSSAPSDDIVIFSHGGYTTKNAKYTKVPEDGSVYFYTFRGAFGTDGQTRAMLRSTDPQLGVTSSNSVMTMQTVDTGLKDVSGNPIMGSKTVPVDGGFDSLTDKSQGELKMADGRVTSIAGPSSKIWDYELSFNESSQRMIDILDNVARSVPGWITRDLFVLNNGSNDARLSEVFAMLNGRAYRYQRYHAAFCRVESATGQAPWDNPKIAG